MMVKKVLVVEDYPSMQKCLRMAIREVYKDELEVLVAGSLTAANTMYAEHRDNIVFVLIDASLGGGEKTFDFVEITLNGFAGAKVAISTEKEFRKKMIELGCTHECDKAQVYNFLLKNRDALV